MATFVKRVPYKTLAYKKRDFRKEEILAVRVPRNGTYHTVAYEVFRLKKKETLDEVLSSKRLWASRVFVVAGNYDISLKY